MKRISTLLVFGTFSLMYAMEGTLKDETTKGTKSQSFKNLVAFSSSLNANNALGATTLHYVVGTDKFKKIIVTLLEHALDEAGSNDLEKSNACIRSVVNARDQEGQTPLHWAAQCLHLASWQQLVLHGADMTVADHEDFTPLHVLNNGPLIDWELDRAKKELFLQFACAPLGGTLTLGQDVRTSQERILGFLRVLQRNNQLPRDMCNALKEDVIKECKDDVIVSPWWQPHKVVSLDQLITYIPYNILIRFIKANFIEMDLAVDVLVKRHRAVLLAVKELERQAGNTLFACKLEILFDQKIKELCAQNYTKLLLESI